MRVPSILFALSATLALALGAGCGGPVTLKTLDAVCAADAECGSGMCKYGKCTRLCAQQGDCPTGFDCGLQKPEDGQMNGVGATCYKASYDTTPAAMGGFGADCSTVAADPKTQMACDPMAKNPCAAGYTCLSSARCDPLAYCTKGCTADTDCPPQMYCGANTGTRPCTADTDCDMGETCKAPPGGDGSIKLCTSPSLCMKRTQCNACGTDDMCPAGYVCATDAGGARFCGKVCDPAAVNSGYYHDCPLPENDSGGSPVSGPFQTCVPASQGSSTNVCRPTAGYCSGPSALPMLMTQMDTVCSPCRPGSPGDCPKGFCYQGQFSLEAFCSQPCTAHVKKGRDQNGQSTYVVTNDSCPTGSHCYAGAQCTECDVKGLCAGDTNPPDPMNLYTTYFALTCYPLMNQ